MEFRKEFEEAKARNDKRVGFQIGSAVITQRGDGIIRELHKHHALWGIKVEGLEYLIWYSPWDINLAA